MPEPEFCGCGHSAAYHAPADEGGACRMAPCGCGAFHDEVMVAQAAEAQANADPVSPLEPCIFCGHDRKEHRDHGPDFKVGCWVKGCRCTGFVSTAVHEALLDGVDELDDAGAVPAAGYAVSPITPCRDCGHPHADHRYLGVVAVGCWSRGCPCTGFTRSDPPDALLKEPPGLVGHQDVKADVAEVDEVYDDIDRWFTYHPPSPEQVPVYERLRGETHDLADLFAAHVPAGVERDRAFAALREAVMWANAGIACAAPAPDPDTLTKVVELLEHMTAPITREASPGLAPVSLVCRCGHHINQHNGMTLTEDMTEVVRGPYCVACGCVDFDPEPEPVHGEADVSVVHFTGLIQWGIRQITGTGDGVEVELEDGTVVTNPDAEWWRAHGCEAVEVDGRGLVSGVSLPKLSVSPPPAAERSMADGGYADHPDLVGPFDEDQILGAGLLAGDDFWWDGVWRHAKLVTFAPSGFRYKTARVQTPAGMLFDIPSDELVRIRRRP